MSLAEDTTVSIPHNSCVSGSLQSFGGAGKCTNKFRTRQNTRAVQKALFTEPLGSKEGTTPVQLVQPYCLTFTCVSLLFLSEICSVSHNES